MRNLLLLALLLFATTGCSQDDRRPLVMSATGTTTQVPDGDTLRLPPRSGLDASKGAASSYAKCIYVATDTQKTYWSNGTTWYPIGLGIAPSSFADNVFYVYDDADGNKRVQFSVGNQTTATALTINTGAQTVDRQLSIPVLSGDRTLAVIDQAQTFTADQTIQSTNGVTTLQGATKDAMKLTGSSSGSGSFVGTITPAALSASRTYTFPDLSLTMAGSASALTSTRIPFATTGGALTDSSTLTLSGGVLTNNNGYFSSGNNVGLITLNVTGGSDQVGMTFQSSLSDKWRFYKESDQSIRLNDVTNSFTPFKLSQGAASASVTNFFTTKSASSSTVGGVTIGDGSTAGTNVSIGGGKVNAGGTITAASTIFSPAATTSIASINIPHGTAPTSPTNGDLWTTTAGAFVQINGSTVGPLGSGGGGGITGSLTAGRITLSTGSSTVSDSAKLLFSTSTGMVANLASSGADNLTLGNTAGDSLTSGAQNTLLGTNAGTALTTTNDITAIGYNALAATTVADNTALGSGAAALVTSATEVTAVGKTAVGAGVAGVTSCTGVGYNALLIATGARNTGIGARAGNAITSGTDNTVVGYVPGGISSGSFNTTLGSTVALGTTLSNNISIGYNSGVSGAGSGRNVVIGNGATVSSASQSIVLGNSATTSTNNTMVCGSESFPINSLYLGKGQLSTVPFAFGICGTDASGTNINGAGIQLIAGAGTGTGPGGAISHRTAPAGTTGSALNTAIDRFTILADGGIQFHGIATASAPAVSAASNGTIYYDNTSQKFRYSQNNGAYADCFGNGTITGDATVTTGNVVVATAGKGLQVKEGSNAKMGLATLSGGTVVVSTTAVTANSRIYLTGQTLGTVSVPSNYGVSARSAGTSFTILASQPTDTSTVAWMIVEPAP